MKTKYCICWGTVLRAHTPECIAHQKAKRKAEREKAHLPFRTLEASLTRYIETLEKTGKEEANFVGTKQTSNGEYLETRIVGRHKQNVALYLRHLLHEAQNLNTPTKKRA